MGAVFRWIKYIYEWCKTFASQIGAGGIPIGAGKVFFVDMLGGNDTYSGADPAKPLRTIKHALSLCVDNRDDRILILKGDLDPTLGTPAPGADEDWPIYINKSRVHIIGVESGSGLYSSTYIRPPTGTDAAAFLFGNVDNCELSNVSLSQGVPGSAHAAIEFLGVGIAGQPDVVSGHGHHVICDCGIAWEGWGQDGILLPQWGQDYCNLEILRCFFAESITRDGIRLNGTSTKFIIRDCIFGGVAGIGINMISTGRIGAILNNKFMTLDADGAAITVHGSAGVIDGNSAGHDQSGGGGYTGPNVPFRDLSTGDNAWGANYVGEALTAPKVT